jgi:hypothetical protein
MEQAVRLWCCWYYRFVVAAAAAGGGLSDGHMNRCLQSVGEYQILLIYTLRNFL